MRLHCGVMMGIGDELCMTALAREYKRARPAEEVHVYASSRPWIWKGNPHIGWGQTENGKEYRPNFFGMLSASTAHGFARDCGIQIVDDTPEIFLSIDECLEDFGIKDFERTVAIDVEAKWPSRQWDPVKMIRAAELLQDDGWRVIEVGKRDDLQNAQRLPADYSFLNKLDPRRNCALLSKCSLYLGMDSGSFHMAAAVGTPQVAVFGPIKWHSRAYWNTTPVFAYSDCSQNCSQTCHRQEKPPFGDVKHCLDEITPERVAEAARVAYNRFVVPGLRISRPAPRVGEPIVQW